MRGSDPQAAAPVVELTHVSLAKGGSAILRDVSWRIERGQHWLVLGPNGAGKTSLLGLLAGRDHPTEGTVDLFGHRVGRVDLRALHPRIGISSPLLTRQFRAGLTAEEVVLAGRHGALETWWHTYTDEDRQKAHELLGKVGLAEQATSSLSTLSTGELRQVQIARALAGNPELLLLDEPAAGLDLGAREELLQRLAELLESNATVAPTVLVTHHLEEVPAGVSHSLLLRQGSVVAAGPVGVVLTDRTISECFGLSLSVVHQGNRWSSMAR